MKRCPGDRLQGSTNPEDISPSHPFSANPLIPTIILPAIAGPPRRSLPAHLDTIWHQIEGSAYKAAAMAENYTVLEELGSTCNNHTAPPYRS